MPGEDEIAAIVAALLALREPAAPAPPQNTSGWRRAAQYPEAPLEDLRLGVAGRV